MKPLWTGFSFIGFIRGGFPEEKEFSVKNKLRVPHARAAYRDGFTVDFNRRQDILSTSGVGRILTWFIVLTAIRARLPSIPCDVSYLSGATLPLRWVSPSSTWWNFSRSLLKRGHFADGDGRVTVVSRHDTRGRVKSDTRHVPAHLKLYHINSRFAGQIPRSEKNFFFGGHHAH